MESGLRTTLEAELERSLAFPYNSMARAYRLGEPDGPSAAKLPENFGGDCLEQVTRLKRRLTEKGIPTKVILSPQEMHFALLGEGFYLDPSLRTLEPVLLNGAEEVMVNVYPRINGRWGNLTARREEQNVLSATWTIHNGERIRAMPPHHFALAEPDATPEENLDNQRAFFAAQRSLYWQIPDPETGEILNVRMMKERESPSISSIGTPGYKPEGDPRFAPLFERVIASTKTNEQEVREFIAETRRRWLGFSSQL